MRWCGAAETPVVIADGGGCIHIRNLIGNAIKFRGAETAIDQISAQAKGKEWVFSVADNGIGIAAEHAEDVLVNLRRLHARAAYPGNGIGLSICQRILEQTGGQSMGRIRSRSGLDLQVHYSGHGNTKRRGGTE